MSGGGASQERHRPQEQKETAALWGQLPPKRIKRIWAEPTQFVFSKFSNQIKLLNGMDGRKDKQGRATPSNTEHTGSSERSGQQWAPKSGKKQNSGWYEDPVIKQGGGAHALQMV